MNDRPIIFTSESVRAILEGRKTQTRRIVKPQPPAGSVSPHYENGWWMWRKWTPEGRAHGINSTRHGDQRSPYGEDGDRLWVRETWQHDALHDDKIYYRADRFAETVFDKWRSSMMMPRSASRIMLEVINVRIERLQDISDNDARDEGVSPKHYNSRADHRDAYIDLWESINAKRAPWASNPWVWVINFKKL